MWSRSGGLLLSSCVLVIAACSGADAGTGETGPAVTTVATSSTTLPTPTSTDATVTSAPGSTAPDGPGSTSAPGSTSTGTATTDPASSSTTTATTTPGSPTSAPDGSSTSAPTTTTPVTTTTVPALDVYDPTCVVKVAAGESLSLIADRYEDEVVTPQTIIAENGLQGEVIHPDQLLDICPGNGLDDITGDQRVDPNDAVQSIKNKEVVMLQQEKLNQLFDGLGIAPLKVDGISGPVTRQRICAFRVAIGFPASTEDMAAGSDEEVWLNLLPTLPIPDSPVRDDERWVLIDQTCQIMFAGAGHDQLVYVFPTSTGMAEFPTRAQERSRVFKYDPASDNGGWHDSIDYPAAEDNPLNGNMYKPLYFDGGQAIHGANTVPTSPQSHGCARLRLEYQDLLVSWLGLADLTSPSYNADRINLRVHIRGEYVPR